jgi:hypothetical protein
MSLTWYWETTVIAENKIYTIICIYSWWMKYSLIDFTMSGIGCDKIRWDRLQFCLTSYRHTSENISQNLGHPRHHDKSTSPTINPAAVESFGVYDSRLVCGGFHNLIRFDCTPFFASCRRHRLLTVTCLDACRCAAYLREQYTASSMHDLFRSKAGGKLLETVN